ncbi:MAG: hypothetical protein EOP06_14145, partial [Proteobacteria bacterium]
MSTEDPTPASDLGPLTSSTPLSRRALLKTGADKALSTAQAAARLPGKLDREIKNNPEAIANQRKQYREYLIERGVNPGEAEKTANAMKPAALRFQMQQTEYLKKSADRQTKTMTDAETIEWFQAQRAEALASGVQSRQFENLVRDALEKMQLPLSCLDVRTQTQLLCWGGAYIIDPLVVAGIGLKAGRIASATINGMEKISGRRAAAGFVNTRAFGIVEVEATHLFSSVVRTVEIPGMPRSMRVREVANDLGDRFMVLERTVRLPDGSTKLLPPRELPIDPLTGTYDANYSAGRELVEGYIEGNKGKVTVAVVDLDNLGFVSKNMTHGAKGSA